MHSTVPDRSSSLTEVELVDHKRFDNLFASYDWASFRAAAHPSSVYARFVEQFLYFTKASNSFWCEEALAIARLNDRSDLVSY